MKLKVRFVAGKSDVSSAYFRNGDKSLAVKTRGSASQNYAPWAISIEVLGKYYFPIAHISYAVRWLARLRHTARN
jgi:hypothetical protein